MYNEQFIVHAGHQDNAWTVVFCLDFVLLAVEAGYLASTIGATSELA